MCRNIFCIRKNIFIHHTHMFNMHRKLFNIWYSCLNMCTSDIRTYFHLFTVHCTSIYGGGSSHTEICMYAKTFKENVDEFWWIFEAGGGIAYQKSIDIFIMLVGRWVGAGVGGRGGIEIASFCPGFCPRGRCCEIVILRTWYYTDPTQTSRQHR